MSHLSDHQIAEAFRHALNNDMGEASRILQNADEPTQLADIARAGHRLSGTAWTIHDAKLLNAKVPSADTDDA